MHMNTLQSKSFIQNEDAHVDQKLTQAERIKVSDSRMFDATVELIVSKGPSGTSLKEVGLLAGYSRGLASHRFGSKEKLFSFTLKRLGDIWLKQLTTATSGLTGIQAVERALDQHYQFCLEDPTNVRTFYTLWFESVNADSELKEEIKNIHQRRLEDVVNWIVEDQSISDEVKFNSVEIAAQFSATVIGIVYYWLANPNEIETTKSLHDGLKQTMQQLITENK